MAEHTIQEQEIEDELKTKGKTAPRLTPKQIDAQIKEELYWNPPGTVLTVCVLILQNGFTTIGHSAPVSSENYDQDLGRRIAKAEARDKIWELEGYRLNQQRYEQEQG